jgi:hypothetical protein
MTQSSARNQPFWWWTTPENIDVLRGILGADYTIKIANSGQLALKITAAQHTDLILHRCHDAGWTAISVPALKAIRSPRYSGYFHYLPRGGNRGQLRVGGAVRLI